MELTNTGPTLPFRTYGYSIDNSRMKNDEKKEVSFGQLPGKLTLIPHYRTQSLLINAGMIL